MSSRLVIVVVEDHDDLREATTEMLIQQGFTTLGVSSAETLDLTGLARSPDIFVIDLNLPGEDGLSLARRLRAENPAVGIIITTARTQINDRLKGYESGADIYLPKPVDPLELVAAIRALGVRVLAQGARDIRFTLDDAHLLILGPKGRAKLSAAEVRLLNAFHESPDGILDRAQVTHLLSPDNPSISVDSLQNRLSHLRKKIQSVGAEAETIQAVRGTGYRLCIEIHRESLPESVLRWQVIE
ncbi:MAG: hypothetical protein RLZZ344_1522 [Pseudomonadota bacterium]|jgi:DNA-binding response OmpR family regulator